MSTLPLISPEAATTVADGGRLSAIRLVGSRVWRAAQGRASYALADQVVYSFGNMMIAALLSRNSSAAQFGIYILTQRALDVLIQLCNVFLWAPFTFHLPGLEDPRRRRYQGSLLASQLLLIAISAGLLYAASAWAGREGAGNLHATFAPLVLASGCILFREFTRRMYFAHLRLREAFWTELVTVLLQVVGVGWLVRRAHLNVASTLYVLSAAAGLVSLWWVLREWQQWTLHLGEFGDDLRRDFRLGRWFFGSNMVFLASAQCNPWVLNGLLGGAAVGTYAIAESLVNIPRVALTSMQNMMGPLLARAQVQEGKSRVHALVQRWNRLLFLGSALFALVLWSSGPALARLIYRRAPADTRQLTFWLALNFIVFASTLAQSYGLTALGRANMPFYANILGLATQALACLPCVRLLRVPGAAVAMLIGSCVVLLVRQVIYSREVRTG